MAEKKEIKDLVIPEITPDEKILQEGVVKSIMIYKRISPVVSLKYALTDRGIWTHHPGSFLAKPRSVFLAYDAVKYYEAYSHLGQDCCVFRPKDGKTFNGFLFEEDHQEVIQILDTYLTRKG